MGLRNSLLQAGGLLLALGLARPCPAIDWAAFDDPKAVLLTDPFAKEIADPNPDDATI
jgi:hypothetical protein